MGRVGIDTLTSVYVALVFHNVPAGFSKATT